jgi:uncharacterized protein
MKHEFAAAHLHIEAFARAAGELVGEERLARFDRIMEETQGLGGEMVVRYSSHGEIRVDRAGVEEPWIHLEVEVTLPLLCQRCLTPVDVDVVFERSFRFVATEELAAVEDEESEEDVLVLHKSFNLLELIEDELLMEMPVAPKHSICPKPVKMQAIDPDFREEEAGKPNPFAALAQLKKGPIG